MAIRTLTYALAATAMTLGTSVQAAAASAPVPARSGAPIGEAEQIGGSAFIPVAIFMLAIIALMVFDDDDGPQSP
jgi:hypothetical protein